MAISGVVSLKSRQVLSLQLVMGLILIIGFTMKWLPTEMVPMSKLVGIGVIAFNVLLIHTGTMIDLKLFINQKTLITFIGLSLLIKGIINLCVMSLLGLKSFALIGMGPLMGGGATAAIASNMLIKVNPEWSLFPWLVFMVQSLISVPFFIWSLKRDVRQKKDSESLNQLLNQPLNQSLGSKSFIQADRGLLNSEYRSTAYYLGLLMMLSLANQFVFGGLTGKLGIHIGVTALLVGFIAQKIGVIEKNPLLKSDAMGLLMIGLMSLMAMTISMTNLSGLMALMYPLVILSVTSVGGTFLVVRLLHSKFNYSFEYSLMVLTSCYIGMPIVNQIMMKTLDQMALKELDKEQYKGTQRMLFIRTNLLVYSVGSILVMNILMFFL
ncbi:hypothetical protein [Fusibacter sp. 3D3]|uniref:hypothetical protein n=1 Tax=Fusibacter sp. 3D3 TaxID=1048380 RepID=UPI001A9A3E8E|nr:hypothetical protein [Fusibacter sp. 3D3]